MEKIENKISTNLLILESKLNELSIIASLQKKPNLSYEGNFHYELHPSPDLLGTIGYDIMELAGFLHVAILKMKLIFNNNCSNLTKVQGRKLQNIITNLVSKFQTLSGHYFTEQELAMKENQLVIYTPVTLYLSKEGDSIKLRVIDRQNFRDVNNGDVIYPLLRGVMEYNSHDDVFKLLLKIKEDAQSQNFVSLYHTHNSKYKGHHLIRGVAHEHSIDEMISFVEKRIKLENNQLSEQEKDDFIERTFSACKLM